MVPHEHDFVAERVRSGERAPHDRLVFRIGFGNDRRIDVDRQTLLRLRDLGLNFLNRDVDVAVQFELDGDVREGLLGSRADVRIPSTLIDRVFDDVRDRGFHRLRRSAGPRDGDVHDRESRRRGAG